MASCCWGSGPSDLPDVIDAGNADALFSDAIDALLAFQRLPMDAPLPSYDVALLRREVELFPEWYVGRELGLTFTDSQQATWQRVSQLLIDSALAQPKVWCIATICRAI